MLSANKTMSTTDPWMLLPTGWDAGVKLADALLHGASFHRLGDGYVETHGDILLRTSMVCVIHRLTCLEIQVSFDAKPIDTWSYDVWPEISPRQVNPEKLQRLLRGLDWVYEVNKLDWRNK